MKIRKDFMYIMLIILTVALAIILFFFPSVISSAFGYDYPYTYENLTQKKDTIEQNNGTIMSNESTILSKTRDLETTEERREQVYEQAREVKSGIRDEDFVLDMPSFLISMEQQAYKDKVTLIIDYAGITTTASNGMSAPGGPEGFEDFGRPGEPGGPEDLDRPGGPDERPEDSERPDRQRGPEGDPNMDMEDDLGQGGPMNDPGAEFDENEDGGADEARRMAEERRNQEQNEEEPANEDPSNEGEDGEEGLGDIMQITGGEVTIQGLDVTTIPIKIEGSFAKVRAYLTYLDKIGMIEPSAIKMSSNGKVVEAGVILNVFHGEVID